MFDSLQAFRAFRSQGAVALAVQASLLARALLRKPLCIGCGAEFGVTVF